MNLYIDMGNTRLKWALAEYSGVCLNNADLDRQLSADWVGMVAPDTAWVCSVAGQSARSVLEHWLARHWGCEVRWLDAQTPYAGMSSQYAENQLGVDRWMAVIGAWAHVGEACSIIDAGSAVTVDALTDSGLFLGGVIMPGYNLMYHVLNQQTDQLDDQLAGSFELQQTSWHGMACSTDVAVQSGVGFSIAAGVAMVLRAQQKKLSRPVRYLFTGGDGEYLRSSIQSMVGNGLLNLGPKENYVTEIVPDLVLNGIQAVARQAHNN